MCAPCICVILALSSHCNKPSDVQMKQTRVEIARLGLLRTSQPHLETLFLEGGSLSRGKPTEKLFSGYKQQLDQPEPQSGAGAMARRRRPLHLAVCRSCRLLCSVTCKQVSLQRAPAQSNLAEPGHSFHFPHCGLCSVRICLCQTSFLVDEGTIDKRAAFLR